MLKKVNPTVVTLGVAGIVALAVGFYVFDINRLRLLCSRGCRRGTLGREAEIQSARNKHARDYNRGRHIHS